MILKVEINNKYKVPFILGKGIKVNVKIVLLSLTYMLVTSSAFAQIIKDGTWGLNYYYSNPLIKTGEGFLQPFEEFNIGIFYINYSEDSKSKKFRRRTSLDYYHFKTFDSDGKIYMGATLSNGILFKQKIYKRLDFVLLAKIGLGWTSLSKFTGNIGGECEIIFYLTKRLAISLGYKNEYFKFKEWTVVDGLGITLRYDFGYDRY